MPQSTLSQANAQNQQVAFDSSKSSTFKEISGASWKISYGDGSSASGDVGTDTIDLGGVKVQNQAIELAKQLSQQFAQVFGVQYSDDCVVAHPDLGKWEWPPWPGVQLH